MKLTSDTVLQGVADALRDQIAPLIDDAFAADATRMAQSLLNIVRLARDDEVAIRVGENRLMRDIFTQAAPVLGDGDLGSRIAEAAQSSDPGLRISELDAETGRLRDLLVELHAHVEDLSGDPARALDQAIWRAMRDIEMPRAPRA